MRKRFNAGDMRTQIVIKALTPDMDADGYPTETWTPIYGDGVTVGCKWINVHGKEVFEAARLDLREPATLLMRYSPLIDARCRVWKLCEAQDPELAYEIISIDDIQDRHELLEIKVQRAVRA